MLAALQVYVAAMIADIGEKCPSATLDRQYLDQLFRGVSAEALQVFRDAAADIRPQANRRAS